MTFAQIIQAYCARFPDEAKHILQESAFLHELEDPRSRSSLEGHLTSSGIVIQNDKILLIKHRYIKEWFQPGGHIDPEEPLLSAAIREVEEETGWRTTLSGVDLPIDIDIHKIPANPLKNEGEHFHVDFAYLLTPVSQTAATDPEMTEWFDLDEMQAPRIKRIILKYRALLK